MNDALRYRIVISYISLAVSLLVLVIYRVGLFWVDPDIGVKYPPYFAAVIMICPVALGLSTAASFICLFLSMFTRSRQLILHRYVPFTLLFALAVVLLCGLALLPVEMT